MLYGSKRNEAKWTQMLGAFSSTIVHRVTNTIILKGKTDILTQAFKYILPSCTKLHRELCQ